LVGAETLSRGREPEGSFPWSGAPRGTLWRFGGRNAVPWKLPRCYLAIRDPKVASRDLAPLDALSRFGTRRSVVAVGHPVGSPVVRRNRRLSMRRCRVSEETRLCLVPASGLPWVLRALVQPTRRSVAPGRAVGSGLPKESFAAGWDSAPVPRRARELRPVQLPPSRRRDGAPACRLRHPVRGGSASWGFAALPEGEVGPPLLCAAGSEAPKSSVAFGTRLRVFKPMTSASSHRFTTREFPEPKPGCSPPSTEVPGPLLSRS
jgi:hypothetical protein